MVKDSKAPGATLREEWARTPALVADSGLSPSFTAQVSGGFFKTLEIEA